MSVARPNSKRTTDGAEVKQAKIHEVRTKTVQCDESGKALPKDADFTHYKTTFNKLIVEEVHKVDSELQPLLFPIGNGTPVRELIVRLGSEVHAVTGFEVLLKKSLLSFPQDARVSIGYTSPQGGDWFVDDHPVVLNDVPEAGGGCCALQ